MELICKDLKWIVISWVYDIAVCIRCNLSIIKFIAHARSYNIIELREQLSYYVWI